MFKSMTIRLRLIAAFAVVLLATVCLGVFSVQRLKAVNAAADDLGSNWLPTANVLGDLSQDFEQYRARQGQYMLAPPELRDGLLKKIHDSDGKLKSDLKAYAPLITKGAEVDLAAEITSNVTAYMTSGDDVLADVAKGDLPAGIALYFGDMQKSADAARKAIRTDRAFQVTEGNKAASKGMALGKSAVSLILTALGFTALVCFIIGFTLIRGISVPINTMAQMMRKLASGQTDAQIPNLGEKNEIGEMAKAVEVFKEGMIRNKALEAEAIESRKSAEAQRKKTMWDLADQFEAAVGSIVEGVSSAATEMQATASQLTSSAQEASAQATSVSAAAEEAGTNVTSVAGSAEELGASVHEISRQVEHSSQKAREAVAEADATAAIVNELSEAAGRINGIVDMITGIASQTNLLALNATIESARAGDAGKGFAVVASEVKQLAGQTSKATADINAQITSIQATTKRAVDAIQNITGTIRDINDSSSTIAAAVEQQGAATSEIVQAVTQASVGTAEVTSNITGVARMAEETGLGASQVLSASSELAHQAETLRHQIQNFLATVRAA